MPISAKDALEKATSTKLLGYEMTWFKSLCLFTDHHIDTYFDGKSVEINFHYPYIEVNGNSKNCSNIYNKMPPFRCKIVISVWLKTYSDLGWKITPIGSDCNYMNSIYKFEIDNRDARIDEILKKDE